MVYQLKLRNRTVTLKEPVNKYLEFVERPGSYLALNELVTVTGQTVTINKPDYLSLIDDFFGDRLVLHRGITRQHPLWYEARFLHVLVPLGADELPSWATNETSFIPFGVGFRQAEKIAQGSAGMGPGDQRDMLADYKLLLPAGGEDLIVVHAPRRMPVEIGLVIRADIGPRDQVAFYNTGEIQVRGPLIDVSLTAVSIMDDALDPPAPMDEVVEYLRRHGELRHARTVKALDASVNGWNRLTGITTRSARGEHARQLMAMRRNSREQLIPLFSKLWNDTEGRRPKYVASDTDLRMFLDSSVNRVAHDAYVAAIAGGAEISEAAQAGCEAALAWAYAWADRNIT